MDWVIITVILVVMLAFNIKCDYHFYKKANQCKSRITKLKKG